MLATLCFNFGGLIGTLLTIPASKFLGRRKMFSVYWIASAVSMFLTFGIDWPGAVRLYFYFLVGLSVFGVFGSFTYYLPELFPTRLRGTGAGFCYNVGRVFAAISKLIERGQIANPVTLKNLFDQDGALAEIGGAGYLARLAASVVTIINAEDYGRTIHDLYLRRQLITIGEDVVNTAHDYDLERDARRLVQLFKARDPRLGIPPSTKKKRSAKKIRFGDKL